MSAELGRLQPAGARLLDRAAPQRLSALQEETQFTLLAVQTLHRCAPQVGREGRLASRSSFAALKLGNEGEGLVLFMFLNRLV